jgi:tyrosyl-tRNA synthetase
MCEFLDELSWREFIHQTTNLEHLKSHLESGKRFAYIGFDSTAPSLHVGSLVQIMILRLFQKHGHTPIVLMGGGTTRVGDPSFKDESRPLLDEDTITKNLQGIKENFKPYIQFEGTSNNAIFLDNYEWLGSLNYLDFLRDYGRHFTVNRMMSFESVKLRLDREQPLTFLEFNYMIMQGYDFLELNRRHDCTLQFGGSDQWGNIVNGVDLTHKVLRKEVYAITTPLITNSSGQKMGKTAKGAIWLNPSMCSPFDFWQYWRNTEDTDVPKFLKLFTDLPKDEIERLEKLEGSEINEAKKILANEITRLNHGEQALNDALGTAQSLFEESSTGYSVKEIIHGRPVLETAIPVIDLEPGDHKIIDLMVGSGFVKSNSEARRLIAGNGVKLNDSPVVSDTYIITPQDFNADHVMKLSFGKKKHVLFTLC